MGVINWYILLFHFWFVFCNNNFILQSSFNQSGWRALIFAGTSTADESMPTLTNKSPKANR